MRARPWTPPWTRPPALSRDGTLHVSRIFDWYGEDFGGPEGVWRFIRRYADPPLAAAMDAAGRHDIAYTPYDWSLNGQ